MKKNEYNEMKVGFIARAMVVTGALLIFTTGWIIGEDRGQRIAESRQELEITKVIVANTEIIDVNGQLSQQIRQNSDIIMRYHHHLDGHDPSVNKVLLCPECWTEEDTPTEFSKYFITEFEDQAEEVPETFGQLLEDCKEIETSIQSAKSSLFGQSVTLQRILDKIRTQRKTNLSLGI
jgi:predicted metallo-beta-lactamase superfamily hydrolase